MHRILLVGLLVLVLSACDDRVAGKGVASETTNGIVLSGTLVDDASRPLAGRRVDLLEALRDSSLSRAETDSKGRWELVAPGPGRYLVAASDLGTGAVQWVSVGTLAQQEVGSLPTVELATLKGRVDPRGGSTTGVVASIPALGLRGELRSDSTFEIAGVPAGWQFVQFRDAEGTIVGEGPFSTWVVSTGRLEVRPRLLLDDFEDDDGGGRLQPVLDGAWWGRWNDTSALADSARTWGGITGLSTDSSAWEGRSLHLRMLVGDPIPGRSDLVRSAGLVLKMGGREDLDPSSIWFPLGAIDSVVFLAKGSGTISFQVRAGTGAGPDATGTFRKAIVLSPDWTRIALSAADFASPEGLSWGASRFREFAWVASDPSSELWLDELELSGARISDFLSR